MKERGANYEYIINHIHYHFHRFFISAGFVINAERKSIMNISRGAVLISLGWCGFVAFTAYYYLALTKYERKLNTIKWKGFFLYVLRLCNFKHVNDIYGHATFSDLKNIHDLMESDDEAMYKNKCYKIESW
ncbi:MAG: hypothetical protein RR863_04635 [Erysipelotrichaceae bacterium]